MLDQFVPEPLRPTVYPRAAMLLFLVRHAHAEKGEPDALRPLSERGRLEARALGEGLAAHATPPRLVLVSPLLRARQTAEAVAQATGAELRVDDRLAPGATDEHFRRALDGATDPVALVGHQPDCSLFATSVTGRDPGFPTGGFAEIELDDDWGRD
jgi:phosphohistidine phosphatase